MRGRCAVIRCRPTTRAFHNPRINAGNRPQPITQGARVVILVEPDPRTHRLLQHLRTITRSLEQLRDHRCRVRRVPGARHDRTQVNAQERVRGEARNDRIQSPAEKNQSRTRLRHAERPRKHCACGGARDGLCYAASTLRVRRVGRFSSQASTAVFDRRGPCAVSMTGRGNPCKSANCRALWRETPAISAISA